MKKLLLGGAALLLAAGAAGYVFFGSNIDRATTVATLFTGEEQYQNFHRMDDMFPVNRLPASDTPYDFPEGDKVTLPATFTYKGETVDTEKFIELTDTGALLVLQDGKVIYENYWLTGGREEQWLSMSVAKSFISTLVGVAVEEGHIKSIEQPVTAYLPDLEGSAYDGVRIKDILQMCGVERGLLGPRLGHKPLRPHLCPWRLAQRLHGHAGTRAGAGHL